MKNFFFPPDISIRVIVDSGIQQTKEVEEGVLLPNITPEDQRRLLNAIPKEYQEGGSEELIEITERAGSTPSRSSCKIMPYLPGTAPCIVLLNGWNK